MAEPELGICWVSLCQVRTRSGKGWPEPCLTQVLGGGVCPTAKMRLSLEIMSCACGGSLRLFKAHRSKGSRDRIVCPEECEWPRIVIKVGFIKGKA